MTTSHTQHVAAAVRAEAARHRVSQRDIADRLGLTQAAVWRRMRGDVPFTASELVEVARLLEVAPAALLPSEPAA